MLLSGLDTVFKTVPTGTFLSACSGNRGHLQDYERGLATNESDLVDGQSRLAREATVSCRFRPLRDGIETAKCHVYHLLDLVVRENFSFEGHGYFINGWQTC